MKSAGFDSYAEAYDADLARGIAVSGEDKTYFAKGRVEWLARCVRRVGFQPKSVIDFGCGTGTAAPFLLDSLGAARVVGADQSENSLAVARRDNASAPRQFVRLDELAAEETFDLAYCNGVFHHIPIEEREEALACIHRSLRSGGIFAFWENNPWNPGTRYVMSRIPFDRDAVPISPAAGRRFLRAGGFEVLRMDFLFIFPRALRRLRGLEPALSGLPLGAQYQILCRRAA